MPADRDEPTRVEAACERMVLGTLVSCAAYRPPGVTVKMAENLHRLSGGRFCLGVGSGWDRPEFEFLGLPLPSGAERSDQLEAVLSACDAAWREFGTGRRLPAAGLGDAGRPLLLVGGEGEKRTLPAAAAFADIANWQVGVSEFARKSRVLAELCESAGRDPATLRRTHAANF